MQFNFEGMTREETETALADAGIAGAALEALLRETGISRHRGRVKRAKEAALSCVTQHDLAGTRSPWIIASFLCRLDYAGVGGRMGVGGDSTVRLPCFRELGSGRKQAKDGEAWTAAIRRTARELFPVGHFDPNPVGLALMSGDHSEGITLTIRDLANLGVLPWARTIAREGLRVASGLDRWFEKDTGDIRLLTTGQSDVLPWAQLVNELEDAIKDLVTVFEEATASDGDAIFAETSTTAATTQGVHDYW